ncbi:hypothetical protein ACOTF1_24480 [Achromobacter ruhlandii]|uniref:hypothetical protein n=1 Tax=Achromobacter ruhlandii TaxID=72557 RepID=UPI003B9CEDBD
MEKDFITRRAPTRLPTDLLINDLDANKPEHPGPVKLTEQQMDAYLNRRREFERMEQFVESTRSAMFFAPDVLR